MTTLSEQAAGEEPPAPPETPPETGAVAVDVATAETGPGTDANAEPRRAEARDAGARARIANLRPLAAIRRWLSQLPGLLAGLWRRVTGGGTWTHLPPLLDSRPRSLREQREVIRAHRFDRPAPDGTAAANWRQALEHAYDAGMWAGFAFKALFMTCEWCTERPRRVAAAAVITAALIRLF